MKNIIISEKQLESLINKSKETKLTESHEEGSYMAKQQLFTIAIMAYKMWESMEDGEQLEDWQESKIAQAEQSVTSVVKSFMYGELTNNTNEVNFNDLVIGK